jgi:two-component system CheB/CheR fusion protein
MQGADTIARETMQRRPTHVVGIGASAGGLEALERFFDHVPKDSGMAFVVVQHLSPDFKSLMDELLARHTELPIRLVEDAMPVVANHVYLIPPKKEMIISEGRLLLSERDPQQELTLPIDVFFRSLAQDLGPRAVAIVLSGGGSDGSRGIRAVHDAGGLVIVQDSETAQFDGMPRTARDAGVADWVLAPEEMPRTLMEHARHAGGAWSRSEVIAPQGLARVYQMLQSGFGIDFTHYKPSTVTRRIERRLRLARAADIEEYAGRLRDHKDELDILYRDLLIGVTRFFRNEEAFRILEHRVLPELFGAGRPDQPLRVWVAGCATGEEVYSLAILLQEASARHDNRQVKIFATDVHRGSLEIAARGVYDEAALGAVSGARLARFFRRQGQAFQVVPELRQMIVFAPHNVVRDAPFTRVDLVSCRNLLIYLQPAAQQKVLGLFHFGLNKGGVVFLGPSESPGVLAHDFATIDGHWRIYRKHSDVRIPVEPRFRMPQRPDERAPSTAQLSRYSLSQLLATYDVLLDEHMAPSLLVTTSGELVHAFAGASKHLALRDGRQALDILDVVSPDLKMILVGGLPRAKKTGSAVVYKGVRIDAEDETLYEVTIKPVAPRPSGEGHLLITIQPVGAAPRIHAPATEMDIGQVSREQIGALENELSYTKENLQAAIEELETSNEELQAANEELLASNEELQSTNEELQSVNEELYTVNAEYQRKITELTELTNDMDNLLASTDIGAIFLDDTLRIRKFTPRIANVFPVVPQDVGRPIQTFTHTTDHPNLPEDLRRVLATGATIEREVRDAAGRACFLRVLPYRARGNVAGVVLTLIDVTTLKAAEDALFHERHLLDSLLGNVRDAIYFKDSEGAFIRANEPLATRLGVAHADTVTGKTARELPARAQAVAIQEKDDAVMRTGHAEHAVLEKRGEGSEVRWDRATRLPIRDRSGEIVGVVGILCDITEDKRAEEKILEAVRRRDQFLAMLSHELRNPLGAIATAIALLWTATEQPERQAKMLGVLERQTQQMSRLLDDLLDASRVTQNKIELRKEVVDLRAVVKDAADAVRTMMETRGISFDVRLPQTPLNVQGDSARLQQIQVNLLSNAAKYTARGGHVVLEATRDGGQAYVRVQDDGAGIPAAMLDSIFDLFVQSRRTLDRAEGGIGVGLTLVRALVTMHGGTVSATSDGEGRGAEFLVRLPLTFDAPTATPDHGGTIPPLKKGTKIVVVEDSVDSRQMLCEVLEQAGFECHEAGNGVDGVALIEKIRPHAAIVDVGLPGLDGFEVARRVRQNAALRETYLVALTGYGQPADRSEALHVGFDEHVVKPLDTSGLVRLLTARTDGRGEPQGAAM